MMAADIGTVLKKKDKNNALHREIQAALTLMDGKLAAAASTAAAPMGGDLAELCLSKGGKRFRPALAYICYRMGGSRGTDILSLMCMIELMHTASLIHDDIVDGAAVRRGLPTINSVRGDSAAVQSGDFLLAKAMELLHIYRGTGINETLADVSYQMCLGEFQQQALRFDLCAASKEIYFGMINRKTAMLIAASCYCGATAGGMCEDDAQRLYRYGKSLGIAFQMRDDLLDYMGKPTAGEAAGQDLRNGIFTLPVIEMVERGASEQICSLLQKCDKTEDEVTRLTEHIKRSGALGYAEAAINEQTWQAAGELDGFSPSPEGAALKDLAFLLSGVKTR